MATTTTQWILELVDKLTAPMKNVIGAADEAAEKVEGVGTKAEGSKEKIKKMSAIDLYAVADSVENLANKFDALNEPGARFNAQLKEVEAITGVTGSALDDLGSKARKTAKDFGGDASAMMESYKSILSRLGPDIANDQKALDLMGRNVATLSKTMGNDAVGAMDALTTSMLQMGVDLSNPMEAAQEMTRMMNVMAAGAKYGAAEVPSVSAAYKVAGVEIKNAKVSFEEGNAALQALAQGGKYGEQGGTALRNILGKMAGIDVIPKDAQEKLKALGVNYDIVSDKTLPLTTRLRELKKAQADATLFAQMFGTENSAAANILVDSIDAQDKMTKAITGTNTATEQADTIMSGWTERMNKVKVWFTDLKIGMFDVTSKITPFIDGLAGTVVVMANLANARTGVVMLFNTLKTMPVVGKLVTWGSTIASAGFKMISAGAKMAGVAIMNIPIIGWIAAIIAGLIALGTYFYKTSATFRGVLMGVWSFIKTFFTGVASFIGDVFKGIWHLIKGVFNPANWFDKNYKFSDGFDKIAGAAKKFGRDLSKAYGEGKKQGEESFYEDNPDKRPAASPAGAKSKTLEIKKPTTKLTTSDLSKGKGNGTSEMKGSGGASIKSISQRIDIKNYFTISADADKSDFESIAEKVVRVINDKLRDGVIVSAN